MSPSPYSASLSNAEPYHCSDLGSLRAITAAELPRLRNLSVEKLVLAPGAIREPHWHSNANQLSYCLQGDILVSILDNDNGFSTFTLTAGEMFFVESGSLHHIENIGGTDAELIMCFRHENPQNFSLAASMGAMTDAVLGNTYDVDMSAWADISRTTQSKPIVRRQGLPNIPHSAKLPNSHKFLVEAMKAPVLNEHGSAKQARSQFWPILHDMSMYSLRVEEDGMREPHWHPSTVEMGYVHRGYARMSIMDLKGVVETYTLQPGDVYFVPAAYPHQIEVLGDQDIHFLIFFDQPMPKDVGYRNSGTAMSRKVLAAAFGVEESRLPALPFTPKDPLIVGKKNPEDPVKAKL
ncbi:RmlC-like cupin [Penicillium lagena]|uniref:RmlC-like cupin n=1 Tax=Penicillium lagena TaxID=94218 RepID=UPI0025402808|nr:RmlC-like cupin [Penicillium lagena]KAJ5604619.1 RmlC-like cupin [Penicillium lagena]